MIKHLASPAVRAWRLGMTGMLAAAGLAAAAPAADAAVARVFVAQHKAPALTPAQQLYLAQHPMRPGQFKPRYLVKPPYVAGALMRMRSTRVMPMSGVNTVPYWSYRVTSPVDHVTYTVNMVGSSPHAATPANTNVTYVPIVLRLHMPGGFVIDPTAVGPCDTESSAQRFFDSPLFQPATNIISNGVNVSGSGQQLVSAFQRAMFWKVVHGTNYGVTLVPSRTTPVVVDWSPWYPDDYVQSVRAACSTAASPVNEPMPIININEYDAELQLIAARYATPTQIPVVMSLDVGIYQNNNTSDCCVLGYHNAVPVPQGVQLYATGAYFDSKFIFNSDYVDISTWAHEISELVADPFVQSIPSTTGGTSANLTPAWGPSGQQSGCQNNLETGDPLSPDQIGNYHDRGILEGGFAYHYQDLAFKDWFYRSPSTGTLGRFSFNGNFTTDAGPVC